MILLLMSLCGISIRGMLLLGKFPSIHIGEARVLMNSDSCDSGHEASEINNFGTGAPGLKINYLQDKNQVETWIHNSIAMHTPTSRELVESFYNEKPSYSYFKGCSTGGAQGFALALFHPTLFDGIISGCAGNWYSHLILGFLWNTVKSQVCPLSLQNT